ncbi:MAG: hypothetical protein QHC77_12010 [Stenotrophomonas sp.]|uniref:hypothetical protein n=1 Tax=Stenotrophomonas sp. TaxID=69392 RepID=UPI0029A8A8F7|nr:hypothetical protein [Stenotrophomonas sp.]MDX3932648.1 hypothetical protein [Stenotrophomonas sp.]
MSALVLSPAQDRAPTRMRQPTKAALRQWLVQATDRIEQLQAEVAELRAGGGLAGVERDQVLTELIEAATNLGHYETLRCSPQETIDYWRNEVQQHRAALTGEQHG